MDISLISMILKNLEKQLMRSWNQKVINNSIHSDKNQKIRMNARKTIVDNYDLKNFYQNK